MRITEGQLRRIIREELLHEGSMNPRAAASRGIELRVKRRENFIEISALTSSGARVGLLSSTESDDPCSGAWQIDGAQVKVNGLGPLMYDLMIDLIHPRPLMSDRAEVTPDARRVWDYYHDRHPDIESMQLDDLRNTLTPVEDDNCEQSSAQIWSDDNFGDEDSWPDSSLSKAYRRRGGGTPTLDELQALGMITFI